MLKKSVILILSILVLIAAAVFIYRYQILQYTAENLIRKYLPDYIKIDTIRFDFGKGEVTLGGFKILNPPKFSKEYLIEIGTIKCNYKMRGRTILDGLELSAPVLTNAALDIERLASGKLNLAEAESLIEKKYPAVSHPEKITASQGPGGAAPAPAGANKRLAALVKIPETFLIKNAKALVIDRMTSANPGMISFENVNAELTMKMDEYYTKLLGVSSSGQGCVNGDNSQTVKWSINLDPTTPRLSMSSRFDVASVLITPFETYYDKYSPLVFKSGRFSGLLIFDFDNGIIGSSDELRLSGLKFSVKPGYENAAFLETTVPDIVKYFTSPYGEIIFDFKIKGDMADPKFYLGPKSKEALISMAVDKISAAIQKNAASGGGAGKNGIGKAQDYINLFNGLIKK